MPSLSPEQQRILNRIKAIGRQKGSTPKEIKAAIETGLVESNLRNLSGGDADSAGWRQERASLYKNPTNLNASIGRFFDETAAVRDKYGSSGDLAAAVQRPAAQYRGRYQQHSGQAQQLLAGAGGGGTAPSGGGGGGGSSTRTTTTTTPGTDNSNARAQLIQSFLGDTKADPVAFAIQARALRDTPGTTSTETEKITGPGDVPRRVAAGESPLAAMATRRADVINKQHLPYKWGGGHGGQTKINAPVPLDCSGAVSKVLGINPRVASQFQNWGRPGDGGSRGVTIYSNPGHVLMKIDGQFFGTSGSNPGGGAGWIPASAVPKEYLSRFTARHSSR